MEVPYLKIDLPYDPAILFLGIYPNKMNLAYGSCLYADDKCSSTHNSSDGKSVKMSTKA